MEETATCDCWSLNIVFAADSKLATSIANALENYLKDSTLNININKKLFKELKKINEIKEEHMIFYIFIVSSYFNGKQCRSIRRFQRKLDHYDDKLNDLLFCVISLNDARDESNKMWQTLKNERESMEFCHNNDDVLIYEDDNLFNDITFSIDEHINKNPVLIKKQKVKEIEKEKEEYDKIYDFTICYGSVSGNSKEICSEIVSMAFIEDNKYVINGAMTLNQLDLNKLFNGKYGEYLIIVVSTTGDGEFPSNADIFYRKLKHKNTTNYCISNINYAILGLGDSNYSQFNAAAKKLDNALSICGANKFYHTGYADDGVGLEDVVEEWKYGVLCEMLRKRKKILPQETQITESEESLFSKSETVNIDNMIIINQIKFRISKMQQSQSQSRSRYELFNDLHSLSSFKAYDATNQFLVELIAAKYLTSYLSTKYNDSIVIQLTLRLPHGYSYEIGDILCIYPSNPDFMVNELLHRLTFDGNDVIKISTINELISTNPIAHIPFKKAITIYDIFRYCIDIRSIPKSKLFIKSLATFCSTKEDKIKLLDLSLKGKWLTLKNKTMYNLLQLLNEFKSCKPTLECLLHFLSPLKPRQYSICSSPSYKVDEIDICLRVLKADNNVADSYDDGICSCFLYSLCCNEAAFLSTNNDILIHRYKYGYYCDNKNNVKIAVYLKLSPTFKPPSNTKCPLIMIGPGTGAAVFRAFLQHQHVQNQNSVNNTMEICDGAWRGIHMMFNDEIETKKLKSKAKSKCILFFGCRHPKKDYLFENDWRQFLENGVLNHLFVAFSRYYNNKVYVQHLLKENSLLISNMILNDNAYIFVCGDASKMAKSVENTMIEIIALHSKMSRSEADKYIQNMKLLNKYNVDVWNSIVL